VSVVVLHLLSVFLGTAFPRYQGFDHLIGELGRTPLQALWGGGQAVTLFFILSGFALHRMLLAQRMHYFAFASRRLIRLWIPYALVVAVSILALHLIGTHRIAGQSAWMNRLLGTVPSAGLVLQHLIAVGEFDTRPIDFVVWSLVQEFRLSLLFPVIFWAINRYHWPSVLISSFALCLLATSMLQLNPESQVSALSTFAVQFLFVIGAILSRQENAIQRLYARTSTISRVTLFAVALVFYSNCLGLSSTYSPVVGATLLFVVALCSPAALRLLSLPWIQWLGAISYSLYLCHGVVLLRLIDLGYPRFSFVEIVAIAGSLSLVAAGLLYRWVERPAIMLSRIVGRRVQRACTAPAPIAG
jgi:peptidoglycan/LPS O-acetylase OafA/YrhL